MRSIILFFVLLAASVYAGTPGYTFGTDTSARTISLSANGGSITFSPIPTDATSKKFYISQQSVANGFGTRPNQIFFSGYNRTGGSLAEAGDYGFGAVYESYYRPSEFEILRELHPATFLLPSGTERRALSFIIYEATASGFKVDDVTGGLKTRRFAHGDQKGGTEALIYTTADAATITNTALTANVVTITTSAAHGLLAGEPVVIAAVTQTTINGTFFVATVPTTTTFTYALTLGNIASGADTGTVTPGALITASNGTYTRYAKNNFAPIKQIKADGSSYESLFKLNASNQLQLLPDAINGGVRVGGIGGVFGGTDDTSADTLLYPTTNAREALVVQSQATQSTPATLFQNSAGSTYVSVGPTQSNTTFSLATGYQNAIFGCSNPSAANPGADAVIVLGGGTNEIRGRAALELKWTSASDALGGTVDTAIARNAAGVLRVSDGTTGIKNFMGGGAAVASAAALPVPTGRVFHVTGTTTFTSITSTNFQSGTVVTMIFDGVITLGSAGNIKLTGAFVTSADDTLTLVFDGVSWFEIGRSVL